ncbi:hypothetical protein [Streptomyces sp. NBC_01276]|uniref:hypothetical protein n=1 Tax=Streptomyces sp. NBC_01276 TaxID=2903808 RepID=UPI00352DB7CE
MRMSALATAGSSLGLVLALASGASAATPAPSADASAKTAPAGTARPTTGAVMHYGYDGAGNTYQSATLDLSDPRAKDPANYLPKKLVDSARAIEAAKTSGKTATPAANAAGAFLCTLYVGGLRDWNLGDLQGTTNQDCSGSFRVQHTNGQFAWDNGGWARFTGSVVGPETTAQHNDTIFMVWCNHPAGYGQKPYRLEARGYATATDGTQVKGYLQYGGSSKWTCL